MLTTASTIRLEKTWSIINAEANGIAIAIKYSVVLAEGWVHVISRADGEGGRSWQRARERLCYL